MLSTREELHNPNDEIQDQKDEEIKRQLFSLLESPKILLTGMPDRQLNHLIGNIAQYPQGPELKKILKFIPDWLRELVNDKLKNLFNPNRATPYAGLHLIGENLKHDVPSAEVTVLHHPKRAEIDKLLEENYFPIIGLAIGAENQIYDAERLVAEIQAQYKKWADNMRFLLLQDRLANEIATEEIEKRFGQQLTMQILRNPDLLDYLTPMVASGSYGAAAAKRMFGDNTVLNQIGAQKNIICWDSPETRATKRAQNEIPYNGEGVHDMRKLLSEMGFSVITPPADPIKPTVIHEEELPIKNPVIQFLKDKIGLSTVPDSRNYVPAAIGCPNKCPFCCTRHQFDGVKTPLFRDVDEIFEMFLTQVEKDEKNDAILPESIFWIQDENFTKTKGAFERMCELVEKSGKNIRWGTNTDIAGLTEYKNNHGDFRGLIRGGVSVLWIGVESKADFFKKRGGAKEEDVVAIVRELQDMGISVIGSFIVGLPIHTEGATVQNADGSYEDLNIEEDIRWWLELNTSCNQVTTFTYFNIVEPGAGITDTRSLIGAPDDEIAHIATTNVSKISSADRIEEIDREARRMFYQENGPVSLRSVITKWDGFKKLKDSNNPAELRAATSYYWAAKRFLHLLSISTIFFSETLFEKCSDTFLQRFAVYLDEVDTFNPPDCPLSDQYRKIFNEHSDKISMLAKIVAEKLRDRFIAKNGKRSKAESDDKAPATVMPPAPLSFSEQPHPI